MYKFLCKFNRCLFLLLLLAFSGCSSIQTNKSDSELAKQLQNARIVLVGETHTNYGHHLNQLSIIRQTHQKWGGVLSIGLEMIQQPYQQYLDDYIAGKITEREMLRATEWYSRWRYDFRLYRPIFDYAKQHKIPLVALNIPQDITRKISKQGIENLSVSERKLLPKLIDKSDTEYAARLKKIFGQHSHGKVFNQKGFDKFVEAQLAWDEGMAFAASKYLKQNPKRRMVILAGSGHLINRSGIPNRLERQLELPKDKLTVVILSHDETPYTKQEADFSLKAKDLELPPLGLIGIGMKDTEQGVQVASLVKNGAAEKAGLLKGDYLLQLNDYSVKRSGDVSLWRYDKMPNEKVNVLIKRGNQQLKKTLVLSAK